jgi:hypothetical protein
MATLNWLALETALSLADDPKPKGWTFSEVSAGIWKIMKDQVQIGVVKLHFVGRSCMLEAIFNTKLSTEEEQYLKHIGELTNKTVDITSKK